MAPHHDTDVNALQRAVVEVHPGEGLRHEARRRTEARAVVVFLKVVVDRLRDVDRAELVVRLFRLLVDDADGVGRIVAADVEKVTDVMRLHHLEHPGAILLVRLVAGGKQSGRRRAGDLLQIVGRLAGEIDEVLVDNAAHAVDRTVNGRHLAEFTGLEGHADDALVDHGSGATTLGDKDFTF